MGRVIDHSGHFGNWDGGVFESILYCRIRLDGRAVEKEVDISLVVVIVDW